MLGKQVKIIIWGTVKNPTEKEYWKCLIPKKSGTEKYKREENT